MKVKKYRVIEEISLFGRRAYRIETLSFFGILWIPLDETANDLSRDEVEAKVKELEKESPSLFDWVFSKN